MPSDGSKAMSKDEPSSAFLSTGFLVVFAVIMAIEAVTSHPGYYPDMTDALWAAIAIVGVSLLAIPLKASPESTRILQTTVYAYSCGLIAGTAIAFHAARPVRVGVLAAWFVVMIAVTRVVLKNHREQYSATADSDDQPPAATD